MTKVMKTKAFRFTPFISVYYRTPVQLCCPRWPDYATLLFFPWGVKPWSGTAPTSKWIRFLKSSKRNDSQFLNCCGTLKVAPSDFWVTLPFNFERQEQHHYQSNRKSNVSGVLEKDESFNWSTFHQDLSYHSNEMTPCPILHKTE